VIHQTWKYRPNTGKEDIHLVIYQILMFLTNIRNTRSIIKKKDKPKEKSKYHSSDDDVIFVPPPPKISRHEVRTPPPPSLTPPPPPSISTSSDSLSIEETNKIRAKLGLKPLQMENKETTKSRDDGLEIIAGDEGEFVHKPALSLTEKK